MTSVAPGVSQLLIRRIVNVYFVETDVPGEWVLVDAGLPGSARIITDAAATKFGLDSRPQAILLTHGHPDHVGAAKELAGRWQVPIIAHPLELPYLTGQAQYPPQDPTVGGSLAFASRFLPRDLPSVGERVQALPLADPEPPFLPGWRWLHVPGHAPGQLAFFREADRTLLGGDAFATCPHDSILTALLNRPQISRAGTPFTYDWEATRQSVQQLANLAPAAIGCGHGPVITGPEAAAGLRQLADNFPVPPRGRYVTQPARTDASGVAFLPPAVPDPLPRQAALLVLGLLTAGAAWVVKGGRRSGRRPLSRRP